MSRTITILLCVCVALTSSVAVASAGGASAAPGKPAQKTTAGRAVELHSARAADSVDRVAVVLEVGGEIKTTEEGKLERSKISVQANLVYDERTLQWSDAPTGRCRSIRHYDEAKATIKIESDTLKPALRPERRLIGVTLDGTTPTLFSPQGNLTRDELDLVEMLGDSLLVDRLLPEQPVRQGDHWTHSDALAQALLGLDAVRSNTLTSTLAQLDGKSALIEMTGHVEGAFGGVSTVIDVKAKYRFVLASKRIDWLGLLVRENRDVGHVAHGVDVVARLRMQVRPMAKSDHLTDAALAQTPREPSDALVRLVFEPAAGGWRFLHDRRWFVMANQHDIGSLRYVDRGELIAQCNVAPLAPVAPGKQITLEKFQADVEKALGDGFGEFVSASQRPNEKDYRIIKVVARGEVSKLPLQWHYYLVADKHGRQVVFTFTVEGPLVERFGNADDELVQSFEFVEHEVAMTPKNRP